MAKRYRHVTRAGYGACFGCGQHIRVADPTCPHCGTDTRLAPRPVQESAGLRGGVLAASLLGLSITAMACGSNEDRDDMGDASADTADVMTDSSPGDSGTDTSADTTTDTTEPDAEEDVITVDAESDTDADVAMAAYGLPADVAFDVPADEGDVGAPEYGLPPDVGTDADEADADETDAAPDETPDGE